MSERLEAVSRFMTTKAALERAKAAHDISIDELKPMGTFNEGGAFVDVSVVSRETIALADIKKQDPGIYEELKARGFVKTSESERLSVKIKELNHAQ